MILQRAILFCFVLLVSSAAAEADLQPFLDRYCFDCHGEEDPKGDLNLENLAWPVSSSNAKEWRKVFDQIDRGDMPPAKKKQPSAAERRRAVNALLAPLIELLEAEKKSQTVLRRLNRVEYRNTIRDLLKVDVSLWDPTEGFPQDETEHGFDNIGEVLVTSDFLLKGQLAAASDAIDRAIQRGPRPEAMLLRTKPPRPLHKQAALTKATWDVVTQQYQEIFTRGYRKGGFIPLPSPKEVEEKNGRPNVKEWSGAPFAGRYRLRVVASYHEDAEWMEEIRYDKSEAPLLALWVAPPGFELPARKNSRDVRLQQWSLPRNGLRHTNEVEIWLEKTWYPKIDWLNGPEKPLSQELVQKYAPEKWENFDRRKASSGKKNAWLYRMRMELAKIYRGPSVQLHEYSIEGPIIEEWPPASHTAVLSGTNILEDFAARAFRRPLLAGEIDPIKRMVAADLRKGADSDSALRNGLRAILVSPQFLYLYENEGRLDDHALANRLSYFLWSTMPDETLRVLALGGKLTDPKVLHAQIERMLADEKARAFVHHFTDRWLELYKLGSMPPDPKGLGALYFEGDLEYNSREETKRFFRHLLDENLSVANFVDSDFAFINYPLAKLYGIPGVTTRAFQKVTLSDPRRGGLLGQASVLTASANGIDTSPVTRGVWVLENLLGTPPLPPPGNVPAIEPDIRGATTIREQLAKHRNIETCNACHRTIDPLGFALENFDPIGAWRDRMPGKGLEVDASGEWSDHSFSNIVGLKNLLRNQEDLVARNLATKLLTYGTGRKLDLTARPHLDRIVAASAKNGHGLRDLLHLVIQSEAFLRK